MPGVPRQTPDDDNFLEQLSCLPTSRSSARSQNGRHSWRSGLIPSFLEPPHRIPSHFPVPSGTVAQVPGLNHPDLSRGQRRYLHSTAQIYSMDGSKRALSNSYYNLLMSELLRGGGAPDSHKRYTVWIYGNHKRLYETNPTIWRSTRKYNNRREISAEERAADSGGRTSSMDSGNGSGHRERSGRHQARGRAGKAAETPAPSSAAAKKPIADVGKSPSSSETAGERKQPELVQAPAPPPRSPPPPQSRRSPGSAGARSLRTRASDADAHAAAVVVATAAPEPLTSGPPRLRSASRRSAQRGAAPAGVRGGNKGGSAEEAVGPDDNADGPRPRDLSKIMY